ncbi:MAG: pyridoxamine 5'-phosphate oxidase family protein [Pseudomonadota bacterium]
MGQFWPTIPEMIKDFIEKQDLFFVATAPTDTDERVNMSPKGYGGLKVIDDRTVGYLDLTGSGNETAAHLLDNGRITIMLFAMEGDAMIVRLYGQGRMVHPRDEEWSKWIPYFEDKPGQRQIMIMDVKEVSESCGFMIPIYEKKADRDDLITWAEENGPEGMEKYRLENNVVSIDGLPTGLIDADEDF